MSKSKCGIYQIECRATGKLYVGSSKQIYVRWSQHRTKLKQGRHTGVRLQNAWSKYGADVFRFSVLEECSREDLDIREQHYIDLLKPALNSMTVVFPRKEPSPEMRAKMSVAMQAFSASITHCPHGHEYDDKNTYRNKDGTRICRTCNKERVAAIYASETPEQREKRLARLAERYRRDYDRLRKLQNSYAEANREKKRAYDKARRDITRQQKRDRIARMTLEQRAEMNRKKRESWARCRKSA